MLLNHFAIDKMRNPRNQIIDSMHCVMESALKDLSDTETCPYELVRKENHLILLQLITCRVLVALAYRADNGRKVCQPIRNILAGN